MIPDKISSIRSAASDMAEECNEISSAATSTSPTDKWWPSNSLSSWSNNNNTNTPWKYPQNPNYSSNISLEVEEDVSMSTSFTNTSNHSGLTIESSRNELIGETPSGNHLWNHVLLRNVGNNGELQNKYQDVGENMISAFSRKNLSNGSLFDPACDYLKKLDNGWDLSSSTPFNNFEKSFNGYNDAIFQPEKRTKLSNNSVSNWFIAPPDTEMNPMLIDPLAYNISLSPTSLDSDVCYMKACVDRKQTNLTLADEQIRGIEASSGNLLQKSLNDIGYQTGIMNNVMVADNSKFYDSNMTDVLCNDGRNYADVMSFTNCLSKPWMNNINATKPILKSWILSDCKKQALQASFTPKVSTCNTVTKGNRRGQVLTNEGKKKRSEGNSSDAVLKMPKQESSLAKSLKVPKAKLGDKITALQQIVSPFGKTDTASVLWEAIGYIKFLKEQVQLLSNPNMKTNAIKDPWGATDRKDRGELRVDLKSRGLCLVPVSCTPQVCSENAGPDYLTPAYRGSVYR